MRICQACGKDATVGEKVGRRDQCPFCGADLHCCFNCTFYEEGAYNACREPQAERVIEKGKSNFCDFFRFREGQPGGRVTSVSGGTRQKLDTLFKKD